VRGVWARLALRLARKLVWVAVILLGITVISFWVIHLAPGSPTDLQTTLNPDAGMEARKRLEKLYGLDKPLYVQYVSWLGRVVRLDFGESLSGDHRPVWDKIVERLPLTFGMNVAALLLTLLIAVPIGVASAYWQGGWLDRGATIFVFIGFAMPGFWLALLLMLLFGIRFPVLPISGLTSLDHAQMSAWGQVWDVTRHLAMPIFIYTFGSLAGMSRFMRTSMLDVLRQDYILTARAKGLPTSQVVFRHALRNALLPVITILGLSVPSLIGGSVIIESIFALPGLGQLFYQGVMSRDYPLIMGNLVLGAVLTLAGNLLADVAYGLADPRIRANGAGGANGGGANGGGA
jgi:peptide/nickel transport system permease protein